MDFEDFRSLFLFPQLHKPVPLPEIKVGIIRNLSKVTSILLEAKQKEDPKKPPRRYISRQKLEELAKPRLAVSSEDSLGYSYFRSREL